MSNTIFSYPPDSTTTYFFSNNKIECSEAIEIYNNQGISETNHPPEWQYVAWETFTQIMEDSAKGCISPSQVHIIADTEDAMSSDVATNATKKASNQTAEILQNKQKLNDFFKSNYFSPSNKSN